MLAVSKWLILLGCTTIISISAYNTSAGKENTSKRPHIVLILVDDMGWNDVSFHGANQILTPNIDALAYNGVILNRHYVLPICTPSRTSLLTSRFAIRDGMQGFPLKAGEPRGIPLNVTLMPEYFQKLGYSTKLVGKWHVGYLTEKYTPSHRGFDSFLGYYNGYITYYNHSIIQVINQLPGTSFYGHDLHRDENRHLNSAYDTGYFTDLITRESEKIIRNNGNSKPLFLQISHLAVHATDADETLEVPDMNEVNINFPYIKDIERRRYAGMMKALDESVGRVVKALSENNMLENSIIVFMADNGAPTFGQYANTGSNYPLRGIKNTLFEGAVRGVACIFSPLIRTPSRVTEKLIHIVDWFPTLYAAAGGNLADIKCPVDGLNLWPTIVNDTKSPRQSMLLNIDEVQGMEAAMIGYYKLVKGAKEVTDGYFGDSGNDPSYPDYKVEKALSSPAGLAIKKIPGFISPSPKKALTLRQMSTVQCKSNLNHANCSKLCLFNVQQDPCELHDLSKENPEIVNSLESMLQRYRSVLMPQQNAPVDLCADPQKFNGTYMPWRKIDDLYKSYTSTCDY